MNKLDPMKIVLSVVDPEYLNDVHVEKITRDGTILKKAIKLSGRNGLYYYFIYRLKEMGVDLPSSEENRWKEENKKLSGFKVCCMFLNTFVFRQYLFLEQKAPFLIPYISL